MHLPTEKPTCFACEAELGESFQAFAFQSHRIEYTRDGDTPSEQACMEAEVDYIVAGFCSSACCKSRLGELLVEQGLPATLKDNRVYGGPLCPCGKCGKPVNLTENHNAWVRAKFFFEELDQGNRTADWFDVLTVVCKQCQSMGIEDELAEDSEIPAHGSMQVPAVVPSEEWGEERGEAPARAIG